MVREGEEWVKGKESVELGRKKWRMGRRWRALKDWVMSGRGKVVVGARGKCGG